MWANRRGHKRRRCAVQVDVVVDGGPERCSGILTDISIGGARLAIASGRLAPGAYVQVFVEAQAEPIAGRVVWSAQGEQAAGVRFLGEARSSLLVHRLVAVAIGTTGSRGIG